jgi:hypothetical protein
VCEPFTYDGNVTKRFLHDDKNMDCDSDEYSATWTTALVLIVVWPIGVPVLYVVLLWASSDAFFSGTPTPLSRATAFLWGDYEAGAFYWEPLEMIRKLTLTGAVLLIGEESEQARVLVALLVSIAFLALHLSIKPMRRYVQLRALGERGRGKPAVSSFCTDYLLGLLRSAFIRTQGRGWRAHDIGRVDPRGDLYVRSAHQVVRHVIGPCCKRCELDGHFRGHLLHLWLGRQCHWCACDHV